MLSPMSGPLTGDPPTISPIATRWPRQSTLTVPFGDAFTAALPYRGEMMELAQCFARAGLDVRSSMSFLFLFFYALDAS